jgi:integrase
LTVIAADNLKPGPARREVPDGKIQGLYLIIQPSGTKSWAFRYRHAGRPRKHTIGPYPAISVSRARDLAQQAAGAVAQGRDPHSERAELRRLQAIAARADRYMLERVVDNFVERYARANLRESTLNECMRVLDKEVVESWRGRTLSEIRRSDVHDLLDRIVDRGSPITANRTLAYFRRMCNWAVERGIIETSPCQGVSAPAVERSRDRILDDDELAAVWKACDRIGVFGPFVRLLILTAQRRDEVAEIRWPELDFDASLWRLPRERTKNDTEHSVPLSKAALDILHAIPRLASDRDLVFTTNGETAVSGFSRCKIRLDTLAQAELGRQGPLPHWTLHDLRRTAASGMARFGFPVHVVEAVLNHRSGKIRGVARVYNRYDYADEKRRALDAWAGHVERIFNKATARA